mmetsp:Transcript_8807/g.13028  ORF Transcript_8807/g.13028 Transcript_8807/m.13028 type:complete len:440 (+) Transcript_8807:92-1411(+)
MDFMRHGCVIIGYCCCAVVICQVVVNAQITASVSPSETERSEKCYDVSGWHDDDGEKYNCEWYAQPVADDDDYYNEGDTRCNLWGSCCQNFGYTAGQACCACGGGFMEGEGVPSGNPSVSLMPTKSDHPTTSPSLSLQPTEFCRDVPGWHDADGPRGGCAWYADPVGDDDEYYSEEDTRCDRFGTSFENNGFTARTACCVCGGGYKLGQDPSMAPTSTPTPTSITTKSPTKSPQPSESLQPSEYCQDVIGWHASDGEQYDCSWFRLTVGDDDFYDQFIGTRCELWGSGFENMGHVADTACCICGGGYRGGNTVPSSRPTEYFSTPPSMKPTIMVPPTKSPRPSAAVRSPKPSMNPSNFLMSNSPSSSIPSSTVTSKSDDFPGLDTDAVDAKTPTFSPVDRIPGTGDESSGYGYRSRAMPSHSFVIAFALTVWFVVPGVL